MANLDKLFINNLYFDGYEERVQTFRLIPDYERIDKFVSDEFTMIPEDELVLKRRDPISYWSPKKKDDVIFECGAYSLRTASPNDVDGELDKFVDSLKTGKDNYFSPEEIKLKYLDKKPLFAFSVGNTPYQIQTTEYLYMLGLFERGEFDSKLLQFFNVSKMAELFTLSDEVSSISMDEIDKLISYGVVADIPDRRANYEDQSRVYKNLKRHYK